MRKKSELKKGEVKCDKCKGKKTIPAEESKSTFIWTEGERVTCTKCNGEGKLDWVENICGKKSKPIIRRAGFFKR